MPGGKRLATPLVEHVLQRPLGALLRLASAPEHLRCEARLGDSEWRCLLYRGHLHRDVHLYGRAAESGDHLNEEPSPARQKQPCARLNVEPDR